MSAGADAQPGGRLLGLRHAGIQVANLARSLEFYVGLLGLEVVDSWARGGVTAQKLVGYPGVEIYGALLSAPNSDATLEVLEYRNVERHTVDAATANPGTAHVCFQVDDLLAIYERLEPAGVPFVSAPLESTAFPGQRVVYMLDPDQIRVELVQLPALEGRA